MEAAPITVTNRRAAHFRKGAPEAADAGAGPLSQTTGILAAGTFLSRLTGFARVLVAAAILGVNGLGDAYNSANTVPNTVYDLLLGGVLSATLIPVFVDELGRRDAREGDRAINAVLTAMICALVVISLALFLLAPLVIDLYFALSNSSGAANERAIGTNLLRLFAPQVLFLGAIVASTALLNSRRRFATAAFSPVANNVIAIGAIVATDVVAHSLNLSAFRHESGALLILGIGTTLGYLVQLIVQLPAMARCGVRLRPVFDFRHPAVKKVASLSTWLIGVVAANQLSFNLIVLLAVRHPGGYTAYTTAYQFFQLPYALLAVSIASAVMPDISERWATGDLLGFRRRIVMATRSTLALLVPAGVGFAFVSGPLVSLAVHHGRVTGSSAHLIGETLALFALGLPGFSAFLPLIRAYQAMKDARTMFWLYA
ncbi:MAG: murein biosynthesis integral membrane protein MurJ, partial [Acidimicrobiales bacterium]